MTLEIIDYDIIGSTHLALAFKRRPVFVGDPSLPVPKDAKGNPTVAVDANGLATRMVSPPGELVRMTLHLDEIDPAAWADVLGKFDAFTAAALAIAETHYAAMLAAPEATTAALDAQISARDAAKAELASLTEQCATKAAELAALDAAPVKP